MAQLARSLASASGSVEIRVGDILTVCTANILTRGMMGRRLFVQENQGEMARQFREMTVELNHLAGVFLVGDFVPALQWLDSKEIIAKMKRLGEKYDAFLDKIIADHLSSGQDKEKDMLGELIRLKDEVIPGEGIRLADTNIKALLLVIVRYRMNFLVSTLSFTKISYYTSNYKFE